MAEDPVGFCVPQCVLNRQENSLLYLILQPLTSTPTPALMIRFAAF